jgi:multiple sugar transport system substrate-binding protein
MSNVYRLLHRITMIVVAASCFALMGLGSVVQAGEFDGVTIKFAKAPHGADEIDLVEKWLAPFKERTGMEIEHIVIPWGELEALYSANFAGSDVYDVTYQTSTHLNLFGARGTFSDLDGGFNGADYASERAHFPDNLVNPSYYNGELYGIPAVIGTIVMYVNLDMLEAAGVAIPTTTDELMAAAKKLQNPPEVWGINIPSTVKDYGWYWFYNMIHNYGGDMVSADMNSATFDSPAVRKALQFAVDLRCNDKVQPPMGQYDREAALSLWKAGKLAFVYEEPSRVIPLETEGLSFDWTIVQPVGATGGKQTQFSTTGYYAVAAKSKQQEAAWELVQYLVGTEFASAFNNHYGFVAARDDIDSTGGNAHLQNNFEWAMTTWDGLLPHPKIAQLLDEFGKALEAVTTCDVSIDEQVVETQDRMEKILARK